MTTRCNVSIFLALLAVTNAAFLFAADSSESETTAEEIASWIELLDHDDFQQRELASQRLVESGSRAIAAVAEAAGSPSQEVTWRAGVILQQIGVSGDEQTMAQVIRAMAKLEKEGKRSFKNSGTEIIKRWKQHRHDRAVATIRRLGGEVVESPNNVFAGGFGAGGGFVPAFGGGGPVIVDFGGGIRVLPDAKLAKVERGKLDRIAKPRVKPVEKVKPIEIPKLPVVRDSFRGVKPKVVEAKPVDEEKTARAVKSDGDAKPAHEQELAENEKKADELKPAPIRAEAIDRFHKELRKHGIDVAPLTLRIGKQAADRVKGADDPEFEDVEDVIEVLELDDLAVEVEPVIAAPVFGGGFGGGFAAPVWTPNVSSSRLVRLGKTWKGTPGDLAVLREITGLGTLEMHDLKLDEATVKQIAQLKNLTRLQLQHARFERELLFALKQAKPNLIIYAVGRTLLGVSGQPHPEGFHITNVVQDSAAYKAGVRVGDVITQAEGIKLTSVDELTIVIAHKKVGDPLEISFKRAGQTQHAVAKLGPR